MGVSTPAGHFPLKNQGGLQGENAEIVVHNSSHHILLQNCCLRKKKANLRSPSLSRNAVCEDQRRQRSKVARELGGRSLWEKKRRRQTGCAPVISCLGDSLEVTGQKFGDLNLW